jgi:hypothetical protein
LRSHDTGVAVEVTHRAKRRLFGLAALAPLAAVVRPPYRPEPGRGRGRPPLIAEQPELPGAPLPPLTPIERTRFDHSELEAVMAYVDQVTRQTRRTLDVLVRGNGDTTRPQTGGGVLVRLRCECLALRLFTLGNERTSAGSEE